MKDLHRLGDDGTGVDLAVDSHDEGLVEEDVCVFCRGGERMCQDMQQRMHSVRFGWGCFEQTVTQNSLERERGLTLTQKNVFWQVPEGRLHHVKVPAAHAVHEGGQKVCCQAASREGRHDYPEEGLKTATLFP